MDEVVNTIHIETDPKEILDRVDEALAWLRIASTAGTHYVTDAYRRSEMYVAVGNGQVGAMTPAGITVHEVVGPEPTRVERIERDVNFVDKLIRAMGERPCMSLLTEGCLDAQEMLVRQSGDNITDCVDEEGDENSFSFYRNVRYHLEGLILLPEAPLAKDYRRLYRLPQTAKVLLYQNHAVMRDGRASAGALPFGYVSNVGLIDPVSGQRIVGVIGDENSSCAPLVAERVVELLASQFARRQSWTVELAATPDRTGVGLSTDAVGAQALVSELRDKNDGAKRMVHWVSRHLRRRRGGGEPSVVRAHLRGKQAFKCGPYWARIYPSRVDIEQACNGSRFDLDAKSM